MDAAYWTFVTEVNRKVLLRIVAGLVAMLPDETVPGITRALHLAIVAILRPAEAAARRLIVVASVGIVVTPRAKRDLPIGGVPKGKGRRKAAPVFGLFDPRRKIGPPPRKKAKGYGPQIIVIGIDEPVFEAQRKASPDDIVDAARLRGRLAALIGALEDVPKQAKRLARVLASKRAKYTRPMRPGRPPGHRESGARSVDKVLADCHIFALEVLDIAERPPPYA